MARWFPPMHSPYDRRRPIFLHAFQILVSFLGASLTSNLYAKDAIDFERDIAPILIQRCLECHSAGDPSGGLNLTNLESAIRGGDSGPAIRPHNASSWLLTRVDAGEMPPEKNGQSQALSDDERAKLKAWIEAGAVWPQSRVLDLFERTTSKRGGRDWWSWQPLRSISLPADVDRSEAIDYFIHRKLQENGLTAAPPAKPRELLRRLYYDLIGLPPSNEALHQFELDPSDQAYERAVDQLLQSQHFGERWARHWLDLVRFAETNGYERDAVKPNAWRYRDWVIDALNKDKPYDRFIIEQIAGDEVSDRSESTVIATGFLRLGTWDDEPNDPLEYQYDRLEDMVHTTTTAFLAMTVKCARCHDHKFDAIPQVDYYRVAAAFWAGPVAHRKREWNGGPTKEELGFDVLGWTDLSREPPALKVLKKGDVHRPIQEVACSGLSSVSGTPAAFEAPSADSKTSLRRLQLAKWIASPSNPLTARVLVNRLWLHHFGEGIVRTPDNFGFLGNRPTHPELLDWLAEEFIRSGWKLKAMHKRIVMSQTYRQSSIHPDQATYNQRDAGNVYWWRAQRRRLDAEQLRDTILQCSGRLDTRMGGPSFHAPISHEALEGLSMKSGAYKASPDDQTRRRSIYMFVKRSLAVPMMTVFDTCDTTAPTGRRDVSIVAPQALTLLNNEWVQQECHAMAGRVVRQAWSIPDRIDQAWQMILGRLPIESEKAYALAFMQDWHARLTAEEGSDQIAWAILCHTLVNTNEFIYLD